MSKKLIKINVLGYSATIVYDEKLQRYKLSGIDPMNVNLDIKEYMIFLSRVQIELSILNI